MPCDFTSLWNLKKMNKQSRKGLMEAENKLMVTRGSGGMDENGEGK